MSTMVPEIDTTTFAIEEELGAVLAEPLHHRLHAHGRVLLAKGVHGSGSVHRRPGQILLLLC